MRRRLTNLHDIRVMGAGLEWKWFKKRPEVGSEIRRAIRGIKR